MKAPVIVIFGVTGDLSKRKLLPALYHLLRQEILPPDTRIVGISRRSLTAESLLSTVELCVLEKDKVCDPAGLELVKNSLSTHQLDPESPADFRALRELLDSFDVHGKRDRLFYMSIPGSAFGPIIKNLAAVGLNEERNRLLLEKPFGDDLRTAEELLELINHAYHEAQIYRIDHYLAKETAQNLLAFRMHNPIFVPLWNGEHIQRIHVRALETLGIEGRASFYEQTGALRDLIQSHLMQLLAITMMDTPLDMSSQAIHRSKEVFLEQLLPADPASAIRAQYDDYRQEVNNPDSYVETYAMLRMQHGSERWKDTEIILETGKGLSAKKTEVIVEFRTPHERRRNNLTFRLQPDEGIGLDLVVKEPGLENRMRHTALNFHYAHEFEDKNIDAYERVLMDAVRGDQALFASDKEVLTTWAALQPVLEAWQKDGQGLQTYKRGSDGPATGEQP
jgi:glucose-6-phosphate 1-dehydrogenase